MIDYPNFDFDPPKAYLIITQIALERPNGTKGIGQWTFLQTDEPKEFELRLSDSDSPVRLVAFAKHAQAGLYACFQVIPRYKVDAVVIVNENGENADVVETFAYFSDWLKDAAPELSEVIDRNFGKRRRR